MVFDGTGTVTYKTLNKQEFDAVTTREKCPSCAENDKVGYISFNIVVIGPAHTTPFSNENDTVLFRIRLPSTLQRPENGSF